MFGARRVLAMLGAACLLTAGGAGLAAADVKPGTESGASVMKTGWWWQANQDATGETDVNPGELPKPGVPEGALPVSAAAGEPEKVSAIEFMVDADPGATVTSFLLSLKESEEPGGSVNSDSEDVAVAACQITDSFWADGQGAAWNRQPTYNDKECVTGKRDEDGIWQFDLTSLAGSWTIGETEVPTSIMLVPEAEAPHSFQAAFDGPDAGGIGIQATSEGGTPPPGPAPPLTGTGGTAGTGGVAGIGNGVSDPGMPATGDDGGGTEDSGGLAAGEEAPEAAGTPPGKDAPTPSDAELAASPSPEPPGLFDGIPAGIWVLIPVMLGLAYVMMLAMGPRGEQGGSVQHGVSRALEKLRTGGSAAKGVS